MTPMISRTRARLSLTTATAIVMLAGCSDPLDFDLRGGLGQFSTASAATGVVTADRPRPDDRGVISYPNYQVAVAERGDTIQSVATRLGVSAPELARFNGIEADVPLRQGEVIALPSRVAEPSPATGAIATGPIQPSNVDIGTLAGDAINRSPQSEGVRTAALPPATAAAPQPQTGDEPTRHKVERGETAYTIARLYDVPVKSLAEWNGLGPDFAIREGQFLLIPVAKQAAPAPADAVTRPGAGSPTPTPPSAEKPLPETDPAPAVEAPPPVDVGEQTQTASDARMVFPVSGSIIREYAKGKNEGINIKAEDGAPVKAADAGTVAAITKSADGIPIIVVRHDPELLTVYANVTDVSVEKGTQVTRGQPMAKLRSGNDAYVHFEVRKGFDSVDPMPYLQ
ncbi:LysM peptidoglycan-binding domain-containing M23 family metallopeptidase [Roseobacter sinensis]|uniref:LysM peptidoglycan-binding domain-containing M23 family metallopeptidase n=1 Tax=Roseobacter sinensis TaxID=2931391 RepID=A0ABT3BFS1_9RHOB|nr:LysM peptidoglycan-binding domain-containing M23 family metallopeptidase [Roseobacter sp. WL0113]MCV3272434.1 LysM peptidoglycan-binding domain-containing M23 family metallopeptidase [Roseobacter sp. WL0113]